jgi:sporulation protein YlmC with PRC-barrel domain
MAQRKTITSDDILGKEAVDPEGQILGIVMKLHIDKDSKQMVGITIDQGFMKPDLFVGINHIKNFGVDTVFLKKVPAEKFKGLEVITSSGKLVGTVKEVKSKRQKVHEIYVSRKGMSGGLLLIPASEIKEIGDSVVLKKGFKPKAP